LKAITAFALICALFGCNKYETETVAGVPAAPPSETTIAVPAEPSSAPNIPVTAPTEKWPDFNFKTTLGKPVSLAAYKGKNVLIDVWSYT
jgi:hypothetical protein